MHHHVAVLIAIVSATPAHAASCPDVDPEAGYPVVATMEGGAAADTAWLTSVARAAAYRWRVPSRRRDAYAGWERARHRLLPPEPRWADDWTPGASHTATLRLVLFRDGRAPRGALVDGSGDRRFDRSLTSVLADPMPGAPLFPGLPTGAADSVVVRLAFGQPPGATDHGVTRFAAAQTRVELRRNTLQVRTPPEHTGRFPATTVKYDVRESGAVDLGSVEFLTPVPAAIEREILNGLRDARFMPATSNCRPIAQTVVQRFGS